MYRAHGRRSRDSVVRVRERAYRTRDLLSTEVRRAAETWHLDTENDISIFHGYERLTSLTEARKTSSEMRWMVFGPDEPTLYVACNIQASRVSMTAGSHGLGRERRLTSRNRSAAKRRSDIVPARVDGRICMSFGYPVRKRP